MILHIPAFLLELGEKNYLSILAVIIPSWAILMIILERFFPYTKGLKLFRRGFWIDLVWYTFVQSKVLEVIIFTYIILYLKNFLGLEHYGPLSNYNFWLLLVFFFVTHDFYIYWFHRLQHNNKYLWRTHEAHHSVRDVDWLAGSRSHPLEILINQTIEFAPIFFLVDSQTAAYLYPAKALLDALWGMWIHSNIDVHSGRLQYLFNGPEMHQWHHANHHEVFYKNYSTKLAIWDWIFGTGFLPNLKPLIFNLSKPKMFGLPYAYPQGYWSQLGYAIIRFDFKYLETKTVYKTIMDFRRIITTKLLSIFGVKAQWIESEFFDRHTTKYQLDEIQKTCSACGVIQKYYYQDQVLVHVCEQCNKHSDLEKFN